MRIERISDNQIKFMLTEGDLIERNIQLHKLSYGDEKTQELFREILNRAMVECDFHTSSDTPLIIEAIPVSRSDIMIIVTKVQNPEDLEDRFGYPPILGKFKSISKEKPLHPQKKSSGSTSGNFDDQEAAPGSQKQVIFAFVNLDQATSACARISGTYIGTNALFKCDGRYYLVVENDRCKITPGQESVLKEYGTKYGGTEMSKTFLLEHGEPLIPSDAINVLSKYLA